MSAARSEAGGTRLFGGLARRIIRHPWYPIIFWVVVLVIALPFLSRLGSVTTNSADTTPSNSASATAAAELARLFPNSTSAASSTILLTGPNLTDANAQGVILNVSQALASDGSLTDVAGVATVYSEYSAYLVGQSRLAIGVVVAALAGASSVPAAVNASAALLWGPPAAYLAAWNATIAGGTPPPAANYPAYEAASASLGSNASAQAVLSAFYYGSASGAGFNATPACWTSTPLGGCADAVARAAEISLVPQFVPVVADQLVPYTALDTLGTANYTEWPSVRAASGIVIGTEAGISGSWTATVWSAFPGLAPTGAQLAGFVGGVVASTTLWREPLPVPYAIRSQFVDAAGTAQVVQVSFTVADDSTNASGGSPVYADLATIDSLVPGVVRASDRTGTIQYYQTGPAPLDLLTQTAVNSSLELVLPLTVGLLLVIAMLYFRSLTTPLVTFGVLGIALVLGLGGTVLIGTVWQHVDTTSLTLEEVFVLGVGTDYSIFLVARYREELVHGASSEDAIVRSVSWAGQSVATSGSTAIIATLALTFSGVALLAQWGAVLSLAILLTVLVSLTMIPACLKLLGPRIFWPSSGERFRRQSARVAERVRTERTYFYRAGRWTQRHPGATVGTILLISVPLVLIALSVPLSYDFYQQLPSGHGATVGLNELGDHFGPGFAVPSFALVSFAAPLVVGNQSNATEFSDVAALTSVANNTAGIASVGSLVGPSGASLADWLALPTLPAAAQQNLLGVLSGYVGNDGRTVLFDLTPSASGLSVGAVNAVNAVKAGFASYATSHPEVTGYSFGGGAPTIDDLATETNTATEYLVLAVSIGLLVVLLVVLRSWIIALMAIATIGISISWAWAVTYLVFQELLGFSLFFYVRTILFILILGLGIDYNIFLLTRVREERVKGRSSGDAAVEAVGRTGGIITAAAIILASAFGALLVGEFTLIRAIGFSVAVAVILDAMVVRTYLVPASLQLLGDRVWSLTGRKPKAAPAAPETSEAPAPTPADAPPAPTS